MPYRIEIKGRITEYINAFGEDLTYDHVKKALISTLEKTNATIRDYTIAPRYLTTESKGCHEWYIEFETTNDDVLGIASMLDKEIRILNFNYDQKRGDSIALLQLEIIPLPKGFYDAFAKNRKKYGAQNKLPKLKNDRFLVTQIKDFLKEFLSKEMNGK